MKYIYALICFSLSVFLWYELRFMFDWASCSSGRCFYWFISSLFGAIFMFISFVIGITVLVDNN